PSRSAAPEWPARRGGTARGSRGPCSCRPSEGATNLLMPPALAQPPGLRGCPPLGLPAILAPLDRRHPDGGSLCHRGSQDAMWALEAAWRPSPVARDEDDIAFVVSFDDKVISLANPDGSTNSARWDELERISIPPDDDPYLI